MKVNAELVNRSNVDFVSEFAFGKVRCQVLDPNDHEVNDWWSNFCIRKNVLQNGVKRFDAHLVLQLLVVDGVEVLEFTLHSHLLNYVGQRLARYHIDSVIFVQHQHLAQAWNPFHLFDAAS